jgi:membrane protein
VRPIDWIKRYPVVWIGLTAVGCWFLSRPARTKEFNIRLPEKDKPKLPRFSFSSLLLKAGVTLGLSAAQQFVRSCFGPLPATKIQRRKEEHRTPDPASDIQKRQAEQPSTKKAIGSYEKGVIALFKNSASQWVADKCPQLGAALAYFTVFSLAPLVVVLLAIFGAVYGGSDQAREKITEQLKYLIDPSGVKVIKDIASQASQPKASLMATIIGVVVALFGASGVFGQLQEALNTIWGVKPKPQNGFTGFIRSRFLSFGMVAGVCFILLVSFTVEGLLRGFNGLLRSALPGGDVLATMLFLIFDLAIVILLFAMIFRFLPDARVAWRDVWIGATLTAVFFLIGKWLLSFYLGSGVAGSAYGAASSLITLLLWIYYAALILLFGAEFTQVYTNTYGSRVKAEKHAVRVEHREVELGR